MTQPTTFFARKLTQLREAAGFSKYELAKRAGLTHQALSLLELGKREPGWVTVQRLIAALGVDCRSFLDPDLAQPVPWEPAQPPGRPRKEAGAKVARGGKTTSQRRKPAPKRKGVRDGG